MVFVERPLAAVLLGVSLLLPCRRPRPACDGAGSRRSGSRPFDGAAPICRVWAISVSVYETGGPGTFR